MDACRWIVVEGFCGCSPDSNDECDTLAIARAVAIGRARELRELGYRVAGSARELAYRAVDPDKGHLDRYIEIVPAED
jgi:hypothetical protein